jgi:hypothetical protein
LFLSAPPVPLSLTEENEGNETATNETAVLPAAEEITRIGKIRRSISPTMKKQFSFTRTPLSTCGRPENEIPTSSQTAEYPRLCTCE